MTLASHAHHDLDPCFVPVAEEVVVGVVTVQDIEHVIVEHMLALENSTPDQPSQS